MWPPNIKEIQNIGKYSLSQFKGNNISVLVYCDNPELMIVNPTEFSNTLYISQEMKFFDNGRIRNIKVIIGKKKKLIIIIMEKELWSVLFGVCGIIGFACPIILMENKINGFLVGFGSGSGGIIGSILSYRYCKE